jgi:hypothetical protein
MFSLLAEDRLSQYCTVRAHHRRGSFIATAFDAKYDGVRIHAWLEYTPSRLAGRPQATA